jgi:hypothetical protein
MPPPGRANVGGAAYSGRARLYSLAFTALLGCLNGAVTAAELLTNGSFENPALTVAQENQNNLGIPPTGWSTTVDASLWNLLRITGAYGGGPAPQDGAQYVDMNGDAVVFQPFTVTGTERRKVTFSAWFSNREPGSHGVGDFTSTLGVYDQAGSTLLSTLETVDREGDAKPSTDWAQGSGVLLLNPGTYQVRVDLGNGHNVDNVSVDADVPDEECRILRLTSSDSPTWFGTGAFTAFCAGSDCEVEMKQEGVFSEGLIVNDGQFPEDCTEPGANAECFPIQAPDPFAAAQGANSWGDFDLSGLVLSNAANATITFGSNGSYTYSGTKLSGHSGSYKVIDCAVAVPVPGTLALLLLPLGGLWFAAWRGRRVSG